MRFLWRLLFAASSVRAAGAATTAAADRYLAALRRELGISRAGGNLSASEMGLLRATGADAAGPRQLLFVVPPKYVLTVQEALGAVGYINRCAHQLPKTLPRHFVLAAWVLHERFLGRRDSLWRLWLETLPALEPTTLWEADELALLEDERAVQRTAALRRQHMAEYDSMVRVLLDECGLEDDLPPGARRPGLAEYIWALAVVHRHAWHFASDFPVLVPLSLRFSVGGSCDVLEWGDEKDPGAALYVGAETGPLVAGDEVSGWAEDADNLELLLRAGYVWDSLEAARPQLQLSASGASGASGGRQQQQQQQQQQQPPIDAEARRDALLHAANLSREMTFELRAGGKSSEGLNAELMTWLRLVMASPEELQRSPSPAPFRDAAAVSLETERRAHAALRGALERELAKFDHALEEDDALLDAAARGSLSPRAVMAVTHRRQLKRVLLHTQRLSDKLLAEWRPPPKTSKRSAAASTVQVDARGAAAVTGAEGVAGGDRARRPRRRRKRRKSTAK